MTMVATAGAVVKTGVVNRDGRGEELVMTRVESG